MDKSHQDSARKEQCVISPGSALGSSDKSNSSPPTQYASQMAKPCEKSESNVPLRVEKSWGQMIRDLEDMSPEEFTAKYKFSRCEGV